MLYFLYRGFQKHTHQCLRRTAAAPKNRMRNYAWLLDKWRPPRGTYIFTDRERMDAWELRICSHLYAHLQNAGTGYRLLNNPARTMDRYELLRTLYQAGINDFNVYLVSERRQPARYPVFIRHVYDHRFPLTSLLHTPAELQQAIDKLKATQEPAEGLLIVEYCAQPVAGKLFRKLSGFRVGDRIIFHHTVHEENWLVKYGTLNSATEALYRDELEMIQNNTFAEELRRVFELAHIEYGRADFGLVDGKIQIYEINTNPTIGRPSTHPNATRMESMNLAWNNYLHALHNIDDSDAKAPPAKKFRHPDVLRLRHSRARLGSLVKRQ